MYRVEFTRFCLPLNSLNVFFLLLLIFSSSFLVWDHNFYPPQFCRAFKISISSSLKIRMALFFQYFTCTCYQFKQVAWIFLLLSVLLLLLASKFTVIAWYVLSLSSYLFVRMFVSTSFILQILNLFCSTRFWFSQHY